MSEQEYVTMGSMAFLKTSEAADTAILAKIEEFTLAKGGLIERNMGAHSIRMQEGDTVEVQFILPRYHNAFTFFKFAEEIRKTVSEVSTVVGRDVDVPKGTLTQLATEVQAKRLTP